MSVTFDFENAPRPTVNLPGRHGPHLAARLDGF
jgi:hypothetical protein